MRVTLNRIIKENSGMRGAFVRVHACFLGVVGDSLNSKLSFFAVATCAVRITPSIAFTFPDRVLIPFRPARVIVHFRPYNVLVNGSVSKNVFACFHGPCFVNILNAIRLLSRRFITTQGRFRA